MVSSSWQGYVSNGGCILERGCGMTSRLWSHEVDYLLVVLNTTHSVAEAPIYLCMMVGSKGVNLRGGGVQDHSPTAPELPTVCFEIYQIYPGPAQRCGL